MNSNSKLLIGLCGGNLCSNGVGKTIAANFLAKKHDFYLCDLLSPISEVAKKLCTWDGKKDNAGLSILNQTCISGQKINENYWFNLSLASIPKEKNRIVFDNLHFKNEANFIHENSGLVIQIEREGFQAMTPDFKIDHLILNNGSLNDFEEKIDDLIKKLYNISNALK